jgi:hypothetical protein
MAAPPCACPRVQLGLIAQDAESVVPEIFVTDPQGWKSVQYSSSPTKLNNATW